ncbi:hypothetical protein [Schaalia canis]|uniref:Uncharacterized protein n=1 Tax=Schaalia canis TaxID=100469 RepID=A0A3P1SGP2_9ACTO|nr:hypothetical protein [Schaalia canis]RRC96110.1 hypothetical protein EII11_00045 [Schaalia canis]
MTDPTSVGRNAVPSPAEGTASLVPDITAQLADLDDHDLDTQITLLGRAEAQLRSALDVTRQRV